MSDNDTCVRIRDESLAYWIFVTPAGAETCAEETEKLVSLCSNIFASFGKLVVPHGVELRLVVFDEDRGLPTFDGSLNPSDRLTREVHDAAGLDFEKFVEATEAPEAGAVWLSRVEFNRTSVKIALPSGEQYVDRSSDIVVDSRGQPWDGDALFDPLAVRVHQVPQLGDFAVEAEQVYLTYVQAYSDVWFDDSDFGIANRRNLSAFLGRLNEALPAAMIERDSDRFPDAELEEIY